MGVIRLNKRRLLTFFCAVATRRAHILKVFIKNGLSLSVMFIGTTLAIMGLYEGLGGLVVRFSLVEMGPIRGEVSLVVDGVRVVFIGVVRLVAGRVLVFSTEYMEGEIFEDRFRLLVFAFVGSIV